VLGKDMNNKVKVVYAGEDPEVAITAFKKIRDEGGKGYQALAVFLKPMDNLHAKFEHEVRA
jgi:hypothetical protein